TLGWRGIDLEEADGGDDHAGRAVSALKAVLFPEGVLQRMQRPVRRETFNRGDVGSVRLNRKHRARLYWPTVDQHVARAALTRIPTDVRAGQAELFAKVVHEQHA